nr:hypothetical protein [Sphingobacterium daejeonense]
MSTDGRSMFTANTVGEVYALDLKSGQKKWSFKNRRESVFYTCLP